VQARAREQLRLRDQAVAEVVADLARLGDAGRLDHDVVPHLAARARQAHQLLDRLQEFLGDRAAGAPVLQLHRVALRVAAAVARALGAEECLVNVDLRHVVHDDAHLQARLVLEEVLEQRRLARPEEAGEERDGHVGPRPGAAASSTRWRVAGGSLGASAKRYE
jgi:hypothetical protein